jgi:hypothetical protein
MNTLAKLLSASLALTAIAGTTLAQAEKGNRPADRPRDQQPERGPREGRPAGRPGGMAPLSPEKAKAAWELQATGVAGRVNLNAEQTQALVKAYTQARTTVQQKQEEIRRARQGGEGDPGSAVEALREAEAAARTEFSKALTDAKITGEQATKVNASLGSIGMTGRGWDVMVDTLAGFNLETGKRQQALNGVEDFVVSMSKVTEGMRGGGGDPQESRAAMDAAREKLNTTLKGVLTEEQLKEFESATGRGSMRRGGPEGGPGRERPEGGPDRPRDGGGPNREPGGPRKK